VYECAGTWIAVGSSSTADLLGNGQRLLKTGSIAGTPKKENDDESHCDDQVDEFRALPFFSQIE
jgi:hypothetical protein